MDILQFDICQPAFISFCFRFLIRRRLWRAIKRISHRRRRRPPAIAWPRCIRRIGQGRTQSVLLSQITELSGRRIGRLPAWRRHHSPERSAGRADGGAHEVIRRLTRRTGDPVSLARQRPSDLRPRQQPRDLRSLPFAGRGRNATGRQNAANLRASWGSRPQLIAIAITFARRQGHDWDEESRPRRGVRGYAETGTCSWGRAVRAYYLGGADCLTRSLTRKVVNTSDGAASVGWPRFLNWGRRQASRQASWPWCWPQPHHFPGVGAFAGPSSGRAFLGTTSGFGGFAVQVRMVRMGNPP
jgi:hypothetical protein